MNTIMYYSPTGNTKYLAYELEKKLKDSSVIDITKPKPLPLENGEHLILMFSIQAFTAPKRVIDTVKELPAGRFKHVSIFAVGTTDAFINDAASLKLKKVLQSKQYPILVDAVIPMPLTLVLKMKESLIKDTIKEAKKTLDTLVTQIENKIPTNKAVPLKAKMIALLGPVEKQAARLFGLELYANKNCTSCSICWNECPVDNIKEKLGKPKFGFQCTMCMKCIYDCPVEAIKPRISRFLPVKGGYQIKDYIDE